MPRVTAIKAQKKGERANVYLDGRFGFGIDWENLVKLGLKIEQELSEEEVEKIVGKAERQKAYNKLLRFAMLRPRSKKEIGDWLKRKKVSEEWHEYLWGKLGKLELVDDRKFAAWWVEQRNAFRPRSKRVLQQELRVKGISREIISEVLAEAEVDEARIARDLIKKNKYRWERFDEKKREQKMREYLMRKGFGWEAVREVVG